MAFLRLMLAFALALAIPIQGFAASTCMCRLHQAQKLARLGAPTAITVHLANPEQAAEARSDGGSPSLADAPLPAKQPVKHAHCASCSMSCCKATVSPSALPTFDGQFAHGERIAYLLSRPASWAEPVPDKPPRS